MSTYFEVATNISVDLLIAPILMLLLMMIVLKYPVFSEVASEVTKIKRITLVRVFAGLMILGVVAFVFSYIKRVELQDIIENAMYSNVEGCLTNYKVKKPKQGTVVESFNVGDVYFEFSNYDDPLYFNGKEHLDNFLKDGRCVSIDYVKKGRINKIIKISSSNLFNKGSL